jgi:nitroreductase/SAM-dependent methyltransferase
MNLDELLKARHSTRSFLNKPVEPDKIRYIVEAARLAPSACNEQLWHFIVITDDAMKRRLVNEAGTAVLVKNAPTLIAVYYHMKNFELGLQSASAAIMSMLLKAADLGLGSLWLGAVGKRSVVNGLLKAPHGLYLVAFVLLGYEASAAASAARKPIDNILHFDYFDGTGFEFRHDPRYWTLEMIKQWQRYYCGKTAQGTLLDVVNRQELSAIKRCINGKVVDLFSYDGSYAECLPDEFVSLNLSQEASDYLKKATNKTVDALTFDGVRLPFEDGSQDNITIIFKIERIPKACWDELFGECRRVLKKNGRLLIAYRNRNSLYQLFYRLSIKILGDDITKTAVHSYFGPFKPASGVERHLEGFAVSVRRFFFVPPVFKEYLDLLFQYFRSGGTTYLHRTRTDNIATRLFSVLVDIFNWLPVFGSLKIIVAEKK